MKKLSVILCTIFTIDASTPVLAQNYSFTTLNYPGASSTTAGGIDGNNIVGWYEDAIGVTHGFLYNGTSWTTLDYPSASSTAVLDIHGNNIVGEYEDATGEHGFLYDGSSWKSLNYPGAFDTYANGIDGSNIVGEYEDASGCSGFKYNYNTNSWNRIWFPTLSNDVLAWGIDGNNIVGEFQDTAFNEHGFFYDGTNAPISLLYPGSPNTVFHGIDGDNIVGIWYIIDESDEYHGTLYNLSSNSWTTIDYPGALSTELFGIDGNNIVGYYFDGSTYHGFVASPMDRKAMPWILLLLLDN